LSVTDSPGLRPTGDRARETLFNWLGQRLIGLRCLDLFAGSGALGLEAASRGASEVVLVEKSPALVAALREQTANWPGSERLQVVQADAMGWLGSQQGRFDMVFIDPPFEMTLHDRILGLLADSNILEPGARVYVESGSDVDSEPDPDGQFELLREKKQGRVLLRLFRFRPTQSV
jgi:16S rRNA (guanine966-N2)-methyltransferase